MKRILPALTIAATLTAASVFAADTAPTNQVSDAIAKLKATPNYSWTATIKMVDSQFGDIGPVKGQDGWLLYSAGGADMGSFFAVGLARNGAAAQEAEITLKNVKELKAADDAALSGDFTAEGAADLLTFGPRQAAGATNDATGGFTAPAPKNPKGTVKFWLKDGALTKYETHLQGTVSFGDAETAMDVTRTVEITDVGTTKMDIPAEAKTKLDAK